MWGGGGNLKQFNVRQQDNKIKQIKRFQYIHKALYVFT